MFTSRSAVESYQTCNRYRYNENFLLGKGVTRVSKSVPLVTGSAVHRGVEHLLNRLRIGETPNVETAVLLAVEQYVNDVGTAGFSGKQLQTDKQQWFTFNEQKALVEACIRAWFLKEMPQIQARYKVLAVERDIEPIEIAPEVMFQAKVDAELQELATGDFHNYSLKTTSQWGERNEESYKSDLQGITETWATEEDARRTNQLIEQTIRAVKEINAAGRFPDKNLLAVDNYFRKKIVDKKISAIRFCYLVKGRRMVPPSQKEDEEAVKITYNPLIRGYKNIGPTRIAYAHSWNYPDPNNRSGMGRLGSGWVPFNAWEEEFGVKGWMEMLEKGVVQPGCGDIVKQQVVTPPEYWRSQSEIEEGMREIRLQEAKIAVYAGTKSESSKQDIMSGIFAHNRKHCFFMYGERCQFYELCWSPEVTDAPIESGLYQIREPHHVAERESYV